MTKLHERRGYGLDECRGATDENGWALRRRPRKLSQHCPVNSAPIPAPVSRGVTGNRVGDLERAIVRGHPSKLVSIDHFVPSARRIQQSRGGTGTCVSIGESRRSVPQ